MLVMVMMPTMMMLIFTYVRTYVALPKVDGVCSNRAAHFFVRDGTSTTN